MVALIIIKPHVAQKDELNNASWWQVFSSKVISATENRAVAMFTIDQHDEPPATHADSVTQAIVENLKNQPSTFVH